MTAPALPRITEQDAENEPSNVRTFPTPAAFPRRSYAISVLSPAGFPILITYTEITLDRLHEAEVNLLENGYMPAEVPSVLGPNAPAPATATPAAQAGEAVCPYHGAMKDSTIPGKEGTKFCSKKMADGTYCKERWPK